MVTSAVFGVVSVLLDYPSHRITWGWFGTVVVEFFRAAPVLIMMRSSSGSFGKYSGLPPACHLHRVVVAGLTLRFGDR